MGEKEIIKKKKGREEAVCFIKIPNQMEDFM